MKNVNNGFFFFFGTIDYMVKREAQHVEGGQDKPMCKHIPTICKCKKA